MTCSKILIVDDTPELLNLLTQLLRENGFDPIPAKCGRDAQRAAQQTPPELAVIDILLQDMTGYQLSETLRHANKSLPIIFISGVFKGTRQSSMAKHKYGASAFFEKPFDAHALLDAIRAHTSAPKVSLPKNAAPALLGNEPGCEEDRKLDPMEISGVLRFAKGKPTFLTPQASVPSTILPPPNFRTASAPPVAAPASQFTGATVFSGILRENLPALINAFHQSQENGELILTRGRIKKVIFFRYGRPIFARSNVISDKFGQFLTRLGKITEEMRIDALQLAGNDDNRLPESLTSLGLMTQAECAYYMGQQIKSIIYSVFCWEDGSYGVTLNKTSPNFPLELDLHPGNLILRATRRLYKGERLQQLVGLTDRPVPSQQPTYALHELELEPWEAKLLTLTDGMHTVSQLIAASNQPALNVLAFIYAMTALTILEKAK